MKRQAIFWILWHVVLAIAVSSLFYAYRQHLLNRAIEINGDYLDKGIPLAKFVPLVRAIATQHPDCRILSVRKHYNTLEIKTAWVTQAHKGVQFGFSENDGEWVKSYDIHAPIEGVAPSELLAILELTGKEPDDLLDKRVLSVTVIDGLVEITTGVTNHSLGGGGNILRFEKIGNDWVKKSAGHWIS